MLVSLNAAFVTSRVLGKMACQCTWAGCMAALSIEQLDGQAEIDEIDQKYENTEHYWRKGRLGVTYITFLDANSIIEHSELSEEDKKTEKVKILEARKAAFGSSFMNFPPWDKKPP